jgi:hypothetical protein
MRPMGFFLVMMLLLACGLFAMTGVRPGQAARGNGRVVYLAGGLSSENIVALTANVGNRGTVLLDMPKSRKYLHAFLKAYRPSRVHLVGSFADGVKAVEKSLEIQAAGALDWKHGVPDDLWKTLFPQADEVIVCAPAPRRLLLQAACLAGAAGAPLFILEGRPHESDKLRRQLAVWRTRKVYAVGDQAGLVCRNLAKIESQLLPDEEAVVAAHLHLQVKSPIQTLVLANPADTGPKQAGMSSLAPWIAAQRRGVLLLTGDKGEDAGALITAALGNPHLAEAENVIFVADLKAIPMATRPNPLAGKDVTISMEPPVPHETDPFTFATGRLFDEDPAVVALMLARQRLLVESKGPRKALIASNPGGGLPLLETISRSTANEFRNAGYQTTALFHNDVHKDELRRLLPEQDIFLWEGHLSTFMSDYGVPAWPEPLRPSLVFLQSCLTLTEPEAQPFLRRGAVAVIGSSARTFSASGGTLTLAYFDALLYERQSLGQALRHAKNFLLAYNQLKKKRLGASTKLGGASHRSAWAFTLWGDPTLRLPAPPPPANALPAVRHTVHDKRITIHMPPTAYKEVQTEKYTAKLWPNGRLAGYVTKSDGKSPRRLLPLVFAEVTLPKARGKQAPDLRTDLPEDRWVFSWDQRRGTGYLLLLPRKSDRKEIHFEVEWGN